MLRIADGDEEAFRILHHQYWNEAYSLALAFLKSPQIAEDVVQNVFIKLWLKRASLPAIEKFRSFFLVMVRNEIISLMRKIKKQERDFITFSRLIPVAESHDHRIILGETEMFVKEALAQLTEQQQHIFKLSREEGLNHVEIASLLGLSRKTVSNTITIVLAHIRRYLFRQGVLLIGLFFLFGLLFNLIIKKY